MPETLTVAGYGVALVGGEALSLMVTAGKKVNCSSVLISSVQPFVISPVSLPTSDISTYLLPLGSTSSSARSEGNECVRPFSRTRTSVMKASEPWSGMVICDGYGDAGPEVARASPGILIFVLLLNTIGADGMVAATCCVVAGHWFCAGRLAPRAGSSAAHKQRHADSRAPIR